MFSLRKMLASASFLLVVLSFVQGGSQLVLERFTAQVRALSCLTVSQDAFSVAAVCEDSFICGNEVNEILLIAAVVALCVFFLIQCVVIVFLSWKISKFQRRLDAYGQRRGTLTYYNTYEMTSKNDVTEERESDTSGRGSVSHYDSSSIKRPSQTIHPIPIKHKSLSGDETVWGMY